MNSFGNMDQNALLEALMLGSMSESSDFDDETDFDDESDFDNESDFDDETDFDDEGWDMESTPARARRGIARSFRSVKYRKARTAKLPQARAKPTTTTLRAPNGQQMKVQLGQSFPTIKQFNDHIAKTNEQFAAALKERRANHAALTKQIAQATSTIDGKLATMDKKVKSLEGRAQTSSLLGLLAGPPKVKSVSLNGQLQPDAKIEFEAADMTLPLILGMSGSGSGSGGLGGGDNMLAIALLLSQKK